MMHSKGPRFGLALARPDGFVQRTTPEVRLDPSGWTAIRRLMWRANANVQAARGFDPQELACDAQSLNMTYQAKTPALAGVPLRFHLDDTEA